uniref:Uncharacterized protein n=1 Tax=viral metagenome TaxID=1070528 RepID=A0A6C0I9R0_9ZZZZ
MNCYLTATVILLAFFTVVLLFLKFTQSRFSETGNFDNLDTRYKYPYDPPVNPVAADSKTIKKIVPSSDLYDPIYYNEGPLNELMYSGGLNEMIQIPLQFNVPNDTEVLRSQNILVTPYNKIKYCN